MNWGKLSLLTASALTMMSCATANQQAPAPVTATSATSATTAATTTGSAAKPVTYVTLPDTYGENAELAQTMLKDLGLTNVQLASSNTKYRTVEQAKDWKVAVMKPGAGTVVKSDAPVVLEVVKVR
jgi:hypothetical protein